MNEKEPYRTPADEPEPEWRELTTFEVKVSQLDEHDGAALAWWNRPTDSTPTHAVRTKDQKAKSELKLGQRVRVVLQVLAAFALAGCSSSSKNDELFGTGGTYGEASVGGSGGAAGAAGAAAGGVAGSVAAGGAAGAGGVAVDAGGTAGSVATGGQAGTPAGGMGGVATGGTGGVPPPTCSCVGPAGNTCAATDFEPPISSGLLCNYPGTTTSCCSCQTGATPSGFCYEGVAHRTPTHTYWCCHT